MLIEKLSKNDFELLQYLFDPKAFTEIMFSDMNNLAEWEEDKFSSVRLYQIPYLSFEYLVAEDQTKTPKENFEIRRGAGTVYALGGRLHGKSLIVEKIDIPASQVFHTNLWSVLASYDFDHIKGIMETVVRVFEDHPFFKLFDFGVNRSPYRITNKMGNLLESINENILSGKKVGQSWFQRHVHKIWYEEASFTNEEATGKRLMSKSEMGKPIERFSGMCNFTKYSPMGRVFFNDDLRNWVVNYPAYVNPFWTEEDEKDAIKEYGGSKNSIGYRVNIEGEVVEDSESVFDIDRVRESYNRKKFIKKFDINKKNYENFKEVIVVERPKNADRIFIGIDVGEGSTPTEMVIIFETNAKYYYIYNISTFQLTDEEDYEIINFLIEKLKVNNIAIDCTSGKGKAIFWRLEKKYSRKNLTWVGFNEKIAVGFEKDEEGHIKVDNKGNLVFHEEYISGWSVQRLKELIYSGRMEFPIDPKFDLEINNFVSKLSGNREVFDSKIGQDHLLQAFRCFAIGQWEIEFKNVKPMEEKSFFKGGVW